MNKQFSFRSLKALCKLTVIAAILCAFSLQGMAQTSAGTDIKNQASATYSDGTNNYNAVSNEVTTTVAKVSGIAITPDNGTAVSVVAGQQNVPFVFTVTNTGNFTDTFNLTNAAAYVSSTLGTVSSVTYTASGIATPTAIGSSVTGITLSQGQSATVTVYVNVNTTAAAGSNFVVYLGDVGTSATSPYDNLAYTASGGRDVYTTGSGAVNGQREGRGDINATVANDAIPQVTLTAPAGPITAGSNISYSAQACNTGSRNLSSPYLIIPLPNEPAPAETVFAGFTGTNSATYNSTRQFSTDGGTTWSAAGAALPATGVTHIRVALIANPLAPSACETITYDITVPANYDATNPVSATVILTGTNSIGSTVSDVSGAGTNGTPTVTTVTKVGAVAIGPDNNPTASGAADVTEKGIVVSPAVPYGSTVSSDPAPVFFINEIKNTGNATDTFTVTAAAPAGASTSVEYCATANTQNCTTWVTTPTAVPVGGTLEVRVKVDLPANTVSGILDTTVTATSANTGSASDTTVDRILLGGIIRMNKTASCAASCVPGDTITYTITFSNVSTTLTASGLVITENGTVAPNNWGSLTTAVGTPAVTGVSGATVSYNAGNTVLTTGSMTLAPGASGTLTFQRKIN